MVRRPRGLTADEQALWDDITHSVRPLRRRPASKTPPEPPAPEPVMARAAHPPAAQRFNPTLAIGSTAPAGARIAIQRAPPPPAPADRGGERKIRRGQVEIDAVLDLHGFTQDQAFAALIGFLQRAHASQASTVLVVTGQGGRIRDGEPAQGVLKRRLPEWLGSPGLKPIVSGMAGAHRRHGGAGACYVFLRRPRPNV